MGIHADFAYKIKGADVLSRNEWVKRLALLVALLAAGCGVLSSRKEGGRPISLADALPGAEGVPGWAPAGEVQVFDAETLYDLVDGQAEAFFAYAFERAAVGDYENAEGAGLRVEVWQVATPVDAYGLFSTYRVGRPVSVGNEGDADPGRRLDFWQDRYFVRVLARQALPEADVRAFADAVAGVLPTGGESPSLVGRLPAGGLAERSAVFFRREISIQDRLWLGGENLLGLGAETQGVLAQYDVGGGTAQLLLVQYPDAASAAAGLGALQGGQVSGLVTAGACENLLGAVFGAMDEASAGELVRAALEP